MAPNLFEPPLYASITEQLSETFLSLTFDASGELLIGWTDRKGRLTVDYFHHGATIRARENTEGYHCPIVQRFGDGRWLTVEARSRRNRRNAQVLSAEFERQCRFSVGDAIEQIIVDRRNRIWIGYFDESGGTGLRRYSDLGELTFDFNQVSGLNIFDLNAMTIDRQGSIWVYPYTDFYLACVTDDQVKVVLEESPVTGARAISVGGHHAAFFGSYDGYQITVCDLRSGRSAGVSLINGEREIEYTHTATYGDRIAVLWQNNIYCFQLKGLIAASGL